MHLIQANCYRTNQIKTVLRFIINVRFVKKKCRFLSNLLLVELKIGRNYLVVDKLAG